jgi:hypothetical protein
LQVAQPPLPPLALPAAEPFPAAPTTARKVKVRVKDQLLLIPLPDPDRTVQWLRGKGEKFAETADQDSPFLVFWDPGLSDQIRYTIINFDVYKNRFS